MQTEPVWYSQNRCRAWETNSGSASHRSTCSGPPGTVNAFSVTRRSAVIEGGVEVKVDRPHTRDCGQFRVRPSSLAPPRSPPHDYKFSPENMTRRGSYFCRTALSRARFGPK